jgi:hypothetical protein
MVMSHDQHAGQDHNIQGGNKSIERVEWFEHLGITLIDQSSSQEKTDSRLKSECLLSCGAESFVFQSAVQKYKDEDTQNCNFSCCFVWMWNLVAHNGAGM